MIAIGLIIAVVIALWLLTRKPSGDADSEDQWHYSKSGDPMRIVDGMRYTVFKSDYRGWSFCECPVNEDDPYYVDGFNSMRTAMDAVDHYIGY